MSEAYDFTTGFGHYDFKPKNIFFVVNPVTKRVTMVRAGSTRGTSVEWSGPSGQLVARADDHKPTYGDGCSDEQKEKLASRIKVVMSHVKEALQLVVCVFP